MPSLTDASDVVAAVVTVLRPPERLLPSEWAERHLLIPAGNALPGPFRFDQTPFWREVVDTRADDAVQDIAVMSGAQVGKTTCLLVVVAYGVDHDPASVLLVQPTEQDARVFMRTKLSPMLEASPAVASKFAPAMGRKASSSATLREFEGGVLHMGWAGSSAALRGRSVPVVLKDEEDAYEDLAGEGHPSDLADARTATFGVRAKRYATSTPTEEAVSRIYRDFEEGDQREWYVECPHCGVEQEMIWGARFDDGWRGHVWDRDPETGEHLPDTVRYRCLECGSDWSSSERVAAIRGGHWVATRPRVGPRRSYHLAGWYSLLVDLPGLVRKWLRANATKDLRTWTNLVEGRPYRASAASFRPPSDADERAAREEDFGPQVPDPVRVITIGIDTQGDRLELEVVGWGRGETSWSLAYERLWGEWHQPEVWGALDSYLARRWYREDGAWFLPSMVFIDSGGTAGATKAVYSWAQGKQSRGIFPIKGTSGWDPPAVRAAKNPTNLRGVQVYLVTLRVDVLKRAVMARLAQEDPDTEGYVHVPRGRDPSWWEGIGSEHLHQAPKAGRIHRSWRLVRPGVRTEPLDCRVYAYGALIASGLRLDGEPPRPPLPDALPPGPRRTRIGKRKGGRRRRG